MFRRLVLTFFFLSSLTLPVFASIMEPSNHELKSFSSSVGFYRERNLYKLELDLRSYNFKNVRIHLDQRGHLVVQAVQRTTVDYGGGSLERKWEQFYFKVPLPYQPSNDKTITASWQEGVLSIVMPILE